MLELFADIHAAIATHGQPGCYTLCGIVYAHNYQQRGFIICQTCANLPEMNLCSHCGRYADVQELTPSFQLCSPCLDAELVRLEQEGGKR